MSADPTTKRDGTPAPNRATAPLIALGVALAVVIASVLVGQTGAVGDSIAGIEDADAFTGYGVTIARVLAEIAAVVVIGALLLAAFLVPPQRSGLVAADGYAGLRMAGAAAWVWFVTAFGAAVFAAADGGGQRVVDILELQALSTLLGDVEQARAWLLTALIALVLALGCRLVLSWGWTVALLVAALGGLVPVALTGHSASGGAHDLATNSLLIHLVAAALWIGGLIALLALGRRRSSNLPLAVTRFSTLALCCWIAMALSGVINSLVRIQPSEVFSTEYGLLLLAKVVALVVLGVFGQQQRSRGVAALRERGDRGAFLQLAGVEVLIMFATLGVAAALGRTEPPAEAAGVPTQMEVALGYELSGPPTLGNVLLAWRFDLIFGTLALALAGLYVAAVLRLRRRGDVWPVSRTLAWLSGCAVILVATSSGIGTYAPAMFSVHMGVHMLLSMLAPVLLVLGGAVTLALRALPAAGKDAAPGPREWLLAFVQSRLSHALTHPVVVLVLFVGSFYALYFSGLFDAALTYHWAHLAMNAHFLVVGYLFFWPLIGVDPAPRRLLPIGRLGLMFASMPFHAFFGVILMNSQTTIGEAFYQSLNLPWDIDLLTDQRLGGGIAWAFGEIPAVVVLVALMVQWAQADERAAKRADRRASSGHDDELESYNAMLRQMSGRRDDDGS